MTQPLVPSSSPAPTSWVRRRVLQPLSDMLRQGLTPHQLALTFVLGTAFGLVPVLGITTLMATFVAVRLRINVAATLVISHLWSPVQLLLIIPMLHLGARLLGVAGPSLTLSKLRHLFTHDVLGAFHLLWHAIVGALILWAVACVVLGPLLYLLLRPLLARILKKRAAAAELQEKRPSTAAGA